MLRKFIQKRLEKLAQKYLQKHKPILVAVVGSVGKTSTKTAIATVLAERFRVRLHNDNHNTHMSVPVAILGIDYPDDIRSISAWLAVWRAARLRIRQPKDVDVIVQELGTDTPGDIPHFGKYLQPDISVVTAISPEHMEFFKTLEAVAKEELSVVQFSKMTAINRDDVPGEYAQYITTSAITTYGMSGSAEYRFIAEDDSLQEGFRGQFVGPEVGQIPTTLRVVGEHNVKTAVAAGMVGAKLGMTRDQIAQGLAKIRPIPGRMRLLRGVEESIIIDDTYNSSPLAAAAALQTLYKVQAPQRIALLGDMNELGDFSPQAHEQLGSLCDPNALAWVVTIGEQSERYLAPAARRRGCQVRSFNSPYQAGAFVHKVLEPKAVILAKGSQNGVFAEEAVKVILHSTEEEKELVRQTPAWLEAKQKAFSISFFKDMP